MLMFVCREYLFVSSMFFCWQCLLLELLPGLVFVSGNSPSLNSMLMFVCQECMFVVSSMFASRQCLL
jgi:hypothetical protein